MISDIFGDNKSLEKGIGLYWGSGGRWFKSSRPDKHKARNSKNLKPLLSKVTEGVVCLFGIIWQICPK